MDKLQFLKKQHLCMFEEKRKSHRELVSGLYKEYIADKEVDEAGKWEFYSNFYRYFSKHFPAEIYEKEWIVGTNWHWRWQLDIEGVTTPQNGGHFIPDYEDFLKKGINGKLSDVYTGAKSNIKIALKAFSEYIKGYAKTAGELAQTSQGEDRKRFLNIANDCKYLSENPPANFRQALQFIWFIQCFLDTESGRAAISFGRIDQYIYPYYKKDIENSIITSEEAIELIMCFYIKVSEGNESTMLTVGGNDENELTGLFIEAQTLIDMRQPSVAVRISDKTSDEVFEKSRNLVLNGGGMPAYFNDSVIVEGLKILGYDDKTAMNYGIVGCYEATPPGAFSNTVAARFNLYDSFDEFLREKAEYSSYKEFLDSYKNYFENYYKNILVPELKDTANHDMNRVSPFASCVLDQRKYLFGINILGIGILIDSIYAIKKLVFDNNFTTINYLVEQAKKDFDDDFLYEKILGLENHYGSNCEESNLLARDITEFIGKVIGEYPLGENIISLPALFWFTADIRMRDYSGTINGRKKGELLSYGVMPSVTPIPEPLTSVLMSCANISSEYFVDGCPAMISLNKKDIEKNNALSSLIKTFFKAGGFHLAVNAIDAKLLKEAQENPSQHNDILVKISGYSTQFTKLDEAMQDAVIERATQEK